MKGDTGDDTARSASEKNTGDDTARSASEKNNNSSTLIDMAQAKEKAHSQTSTNSQIMIQEMQAADANENFTGGLQMSLHPNEALGEGGRLDNDTEKILKSAFDPVQRTSCGIYVPGGPFASPFQCQSICNQAVWLSPQPFEAWCLYKQGICGCFFHTGCCPFI